MKAVEMMTPLPKWRKTCREEACILDACYQLLDVAAYEEKIVDGVIHAGFLPQHGRQEDAKPARDEKHEESDDMQSKIVVCKDCSARSGDASRAVPVCSMLYAALATFLRDFGAIFLIFLAVPMVDMECLYR